MKSGYSSLAQQRHHWTRRMFVESIVGMAAAGTVAPLGWGMSAKSAETERPAAGSRPALPHRYRAVSWWLTWEDLTWPNQVLMNKVRYRADTCAKNGVNCCLVFGAHFRWDFMPIWERLHDLLRFIRTELSQREILLFDHHSSVLTHRPRNQEEALNIWRRNRHHVPFYPSNAAAERLESNGSRLNDWRMIDVGTGAPAYMPAYNSEQYCMNNPAFRRAYAGYVARLVQETGIDGLMSDDGIYYPGWRACACKHCRERFQREYGHNLPAISDTGFWGNRRSAAFRDWIEMRFKSSMDFLGVVKSALPAGFPLLTCCSSSEGYSMPSNGMSYQDFIEHCNHVLLEMTGSTPSVAGTWDDRIPSQLLHLGIATRHEVPCFGLGYGFFPDTAFFVWALNKFLGSDTWFSTLKGRLSGADQDIERLADDSELVGEGFRWEKAHPELFQGQINTDISVLFSRSTRDYYGQCHEDYVRDYYGGCLALMRDNLSFDVVTEVPAFDQRRVLVLSSAICLSGAERAALKQFLEAGGSAIATGPTGTHDQRANPAAKPWLNELGIQCDVLEPERSGAFPPYSNLKAPVELATCRVTEKAGNRDSEGWFRVRVGQGELLWHPDRLVEKAVASAVVKRVRSRTSRVAAVSNLPEGWSLREYRTNDRLFIHGLPTKVGTKLHASLRNEFVRQGIIEKLTYSPLPNHVLLEIRSNCSEVMFHSPDLDAARTGHRDESGLWSLDVSGVSRYFVIEVVLPS